MTDTEVRTATNTPQVREKMSFEEFLDWLDEDTWAEWVKGEAIVFSPASLRHQQIKKFLVMLMDLFVQQRDLGILLDAPFLMKLEERAREPDILFVARSNSARLQKTYLDGPADLIVEIVSPDSTTRDYRDKYLEYEAAGIGEYWLIDPDRVWAEFYRLGEQGRYRTVLADREGKFCSEALPGLWLRVEWLWQDPLPPTLEVLKALGVS